MKTIKITALFLIMIQSFSTMQLHAQTLYKPSKSNAQNSAADTDVDKASLIKPRIFDKKNSLKIGLLSPFITTLSVFYTRYLDKETAFQIGIATMNDFLYDGNKFTINAQALTVEYRYLLAGTHDLCTYIQPFARAINANSKVTASTTTDPYTGITTVSKSYNENTLSAGLGFVIGSQTVFKNRILIDVYGGPVYSIQVLRNGDAPAGTYPSGFPSSRGTLDDPIVKNYGVRGGFCLGFLF